MWLALGTAAIVAAVLGWELAAPRVRAEVPRVKEAIARRRARRRVPEVSYDPGRERRAEQRARELLRSCVNEEEWAMYRDLGFLRVWSPHSGGLVAGGAVGAPYAYLVYPHRPIVAYVPQTHRLLNEYCIAFPDDSRPYGSARLPDSDDVLAKWMALTGDERRLISTANMHLPGRQLDPAQVKRDLWRLSQWERAWMRHAANAASNAAENAG